MQYVNLKASKLLQSDTVIILNYCLQSQIYGN